MVTTAEQGRLTRSRLMDAAAELIAERGGGAVTTRLVAERAGLRPGLVHYHFNSVTDLLIDSSLREAHTAIAQVLQAALAPTAPDPVGQLVAAGAALGTGPGHSGAVFIEMLLAARRHERLRSALADMLRQARAAIGQHVHAANPGADADATAEVLLAALDGLLLHRLLDPAVSALSVGGPLRRLAGISENRASERRNR